MKGGGRCRPERKLDDNICIIHLGVHEIYSCVN